MDPITGTPNGLPGPTWSDFLSLEPETNSEHHWVYPTNALLLPPAPQNNDVLVWKIIGQVPVRQLCGSLYKRWRKGKQQLFWN